ncbi:MAG: CopG family transcriptional regulator [Ramlibacter sp.]
MELKTARLTILIDPAKKQAFEGLCRQQDMTPSQVVRRLIREFMEGQEPPVAAARRAPARKPTPLKRSR